MICLPHVGAGTVMVEVTVIVSVSVLVIAVDLDGLNNSTKRLGTLMQDQLTWWW